jgi:hypothetical protein
MLKTKSAINGSLDLETTNFLAYLLIILIINNPNTSITDENSTLGKNS